MTLLRWLNFLLRSQAVILIVLLFCIYLFLLMLVFVLQWLSLYWKILIMLLSCCWLSFKFTTRCAISFQVGIDVYISHRKYVKTHSSPCFSAACAAVIVHINYFFHLHQKDKSSGFKVKFRQASNRCKRVLEAPKLAKSPSLPRNLALVTFGELLIVF